MQYTKEKMQDMVLLNELGSLEIMRRVNFSYRYLYKTDLSKSILRCSNFRYADMRGADLRESDLTGSDLRDINLRGANLTDANLTNIQHSNQPEILAELKRQRREK